MNPILEKKYLGKKVFKHRTELDLTQSSLGELVGVTDKYIGDIERGMIYPGFPTIRRLCYSFNVSYSYLTSTENERLPGIIQKLNKLNPGELRIVETLIDSIEANRFGGDNELMRENLSFDSLRKEK